jgi:hypothetical protein
MTGGGEGRMKVQLQLLVKLALVISFPNHFTLWENAIGTQSIGDSLGSKNELEVQILKI